MAVGQHPAPVAADRPTGTTAGYVAAAVVNAILLVAVNSDALWNWLTFVTPDVGLVLPIVRLSLTAAIVVNLAYVVYDARWFHAATQVVVLAINLRATVRILRVFPFDFSGYDLPWATVVRVVLIVALVGIAIAMVVEVVRFIGAVARAAGDG